MFKHLGPFSDLVEKAKTIHPIHPVARPGPDTRKRLWEVLGFSLNADEPTDVMVGDPWELDGVEGREVSWSVGYGPRTSAWLLKPSGTSTSPMPAVLALHDHGDFKFFGKEKIANGPIAPDNSIVQHREAAYGGRAYANELAKRGFVVLVHDTFLWGSRRFPYETIPEYQRAVAERTVDLLTDSSTPREIALYNVAAQHHEHIIEKYCSLLGTTFAGLVSYEDRVALNYLISRSEVDSKRVACIGLSGGGNRAALLTATHESVQATVIVGLMSTYQGLFDKNVASHTWMLYPSGWPRHGDWPDVVASRAPNPLLVQYDLDDELFTQSGMEAAHERLRDHFAWAGASGQYTGEFYEGPHKFDLPMQEAAFRWLGTHLDASSPQRFK